jgi:hypothetical protein
MTAAHCRVCGDPATCPLPIAAIEAINADGITDNREVARELNARNIPSPGLLRTARWTAGLVQTQLARDRGVPHEGLCRRCLIRWKKFVRQVRAGGFVGIRRSGEGAEIAVADIYAYWIAHVFAQRTRAGRPHHHKRVKVPAVITDDGGPASRHLPLFAAADYDAWKGRLKRG